MPQPTGRDLHVDRLLSDLSIAFMNEPSAYVADQIFPVVPTNKQSDKYAQYRKGDWFRDEAKKRAPLTESAGGGYELEDPGTFFCDEYAYHKDIADEDIDNADEVFDLEEEATQYVTEKLRLRREVAWGSEFFGASIWDKDLSGQTDAPGTDEFLVWDDSSSTPLEDIEDAKSIIKLATGLMPNTLVVSERVHQTLKHHVDIKDVFKYTQAAVITQQLLARVFEIDNYFIAKAVKASNPEDTDGDTNDELEYILDQYGALLVYAAPRPTKRRPSGGYTFRWKRPVIAGREGQRLEATVRKFRIDKIGGLRVEGAFYEDMRLIANECGVFFKDAIAAGRTITS